MIEKITQEEAVRICEEISKKAEEERRYPCEDCDGEAVIQKLRVENKKLQLNLQEEHQAYIHKHNMNVELYAKVEQLEKENEELKKKIGDMEFNILMRLDTETEELKRKVEELECERMDKYSSLMKEILAELKGLKKESEQE